MIVMERIIWSQGEEAAGQTGVLFPVGVIAGRGRSHHAKHGASFVCIGVGEH